MGKSDVKLHGPLGFREWALAAVFIVLVLGLFVNFNQSQSQLDRLNRLATTGAEQRNTIVHNQSIIIHNQAILCSGIEMFSKQHVKIEQALHIHDTLANDIARRCTHIDTNFEP